jgi:hypothetical protein
VIDSFVQASIEIDKRIARPELFLEFIARYDFVRVRQQKHEDLERLIPEFDPHTLLAQFARVQIYFEYPKADKAGISQHTQAS